MKNIILTYGLVSGLVIILTTIGTTLAVGDGPPVGAWLGYLVMLVALSSILVGVKQYRDRNLGGVIRFVPAFLLGLGIAAVASVVYVAVWEVYLAQSGHAFIERYIASTLEAKRASGVSEADYERAVAQMEAMRRQYANPLFRVPITFTEIFPVGLLVALISAAVVRNPKFLPAHPPVQAG